MSTNKETKVLEEIFGSVYLAYNPSQELFFNYRILLEEKKSLLNRINDYLLSESNTRLVIEDWELDLILIPELSSQNDNIIPFRKYYSLEELEIIEALKSIAYQPESLTIEQQEILYKLFRNRYRIATIINTSGNGLSLDQVTLNNIISLTNSRVITSGKTIAIYESLCQKLGLTKKSVNHTLELKIS